MTIEQLEVLALERSEEDRERLAHRLIASLSEELDLRHTGLESDLLAVLGGDGSEGEEDDDLGLGPGITDIECLWEDDGDLWPGRSGSSRR